MPDTPLNTVSFKPKPKPKPKHRSAPPTTARTPTPLVKPHLDSKSSHEPKENRPDLHQFDSFSSYMHHKNRKLRQQFTSEFSKSPSSPSSSTTSIFKHVVVWVDGHTKPSRLEIRRIMGMHGGRLETYLTSRVTHVVASNLATATRLRFANKASAAARVKLVSPLWITESLAQKKKLPETAYPIPFMDNPHQTSLTSFFSRDSSKQKHKSKQPPHTTPLPQSPNAK